MSPSSGLPLFLLHSFPPDAQWPGTLLLLPGGTHISAKFGCRVVLYIGRGPAISCVLTRCYHSCASADFLIDIDDTLLPVDFEDLMQRSSSEQAFNLIVGPPGLRCAK
jgi:hypothetical protein